MFLNVKKKKKLCRTKIRPIRKIVNVVYVYRSGPSLCIKINNQQIAYCYSLNLTRAKWQKVLHNITKYKSPIHTIYNN